MEAPGTVPFGLGHLGRAQEPGMATWCPLQACCRSRHPESLERKLTWNQEAWSLPPPEPPQCPVSRLLNYWDSVSAPVTREAGPEASQGPHPVGCRAKSGLAVAAVPTEWGRGERSRKPSVWWFLSECCVPLRG